MAGGEAVLERLTHPEVADFLIRGARFIKWDEVRGMTFYTDLISVSHAIFDSVDRFRFDLHFSIRMEAL